MEKKIKEYWNNRPCNINHSKKEFMSKEYFEEIEKKKFYVESHIEDFSEFKKYKDKKVLEIGCGIGTCGVKFAREGADYTGIELSNESLEITKKRFDVYSLEGKFHLLNAEDMGIFEDNTFDLVYSFGVIHHAENPEKIIDEVYRVLKKGGEFKLMMYASNSWKKIFIDEKLDQYEAQDNCPIAYTYTNDEIYDLLKRFSNIKIEQDHIFPYKLDDYKNNIYTYVDYFSCLPDKIFCKLEKRLGWHLCITCNKLDSILNEERVETIYSHPWEHIVIENMFKSNLIQEVSNSIPDYSDKYWNDGNHFINENANKKEIIDKSKFCSSLQEIINYFSSPQFINRLEKLTNISKLFINDNLTGGGLVISPIKAKLEKHIDFNYNNELKMYRAVNLICYFNEDWKEEFGGNFQLYNKELEEVKKISPILNRVLIFKSNNRTIHGFDMINNKSRKSLNLWYYTKDKPIYVDYKEHKTIWF